MAKKTLTSVELANNKQFPEFITKHALFSNPIPIRKVFPSIGLDNFKEKANIAKCFVDLKKEGTYVFNLLKTMLDILNQAKQELSNQADRLLYLGSKENREQNREIHSNLYKLNSVLDEVIPCIDPTIPDTLNNAIQIIDNKIFLRLTKEIFDANGKRLFGKDESLFKTFSKIKDKCASVGVNVVSLDTMDTFKIFSKENIPNKEFNIVFSSSGEEGAWDISTMSMRGIKSCQRWDGEYPRCLIGSILSKFVGVIYLTSGVPSETNAGYTNLGSKMMRRCVVRYAIDADENKPCILVDKMYTELDKEILAAFLKAIKSRTKLPVYYAPELGNKLRHIYLPSEKFSFLKDKSKEKTEMEISARDMSYQDTPVKSKQDLSIFILNHSKEEVEREVKGFKVNLSLFIARKMEQIYTGHISVNDELKKTISNIRMNTSFTPVCDSIVSHMMGPFRAPSSNEYINSKTYYRKYLMEILLKRKQIISSSTGNIITTVGQSTSREVNAKVFVDYVMSLLIEFTKLEAKKLVS